MEREKISKQLQYLFKYEQVCDIDFNANRYFNDKFKINIDKNIDLSNKVQLEQFIKKLDDDQIYVIKNVIEKDKCQQNIKTGEGFYKSDFILSNRLTPDNIVEMNNLEMALVEMETEQLNKKYESIFKRTWPSELNYMFVTLLDICILPTIFTKGKVLFDKESAANNLLLHGYKNYMECLLGVANNERERYGLHELHDNSTGILFKDNANEFCRYFYTRLKGWMSPDDEWGKYFNTDSRKQSIVNTIYLMLGSACYNYLFEYQLYNNCYTEQQNQAIQQASRSFNPVSRCMCVGQK